MTPRQRINNSQYRNLHHWLDRNFKKSKCEGEECLGKSERFDWALKKGFEYERKRENYLVLCKSCHTRYDFSENTRKKLSESAARTLNGYKKGHKHYLIKDIDSFRKKMREIALSIGSKPDFTGRKHSEESRRKMSERGKANWAKKKLSTTPLQTTLAATPM